MRAGDHVLALGVEQDVAVQRGSPVAGSRVNSDARRRVVAAVAEDHRLDRHGGPEVVGDALLRADRRSPGRCSTSGRRPRSRGAAGPTDRRAPRRRRRCPGNSPRTARGSSGRTPRRPTRRARPAVVASFSPRLRIVSIIPGIDTGAPDRTLTSSGSAASPKPRPTAASSSAIRVAQLGIEPVRPAVGEERPAGRGRDREAGRHRQPEVADHHAEVRGLATDESPWPRPGNRRGAR